MKKTKKAQPASSCASTGPHPVRQTPRKKGQAALEFLTTYGWAFLIVLVMIGALAYFGVLDPSRLLPDKCVFGSGLGCQDFVAVDANNNIKAQLLNGFGYTITVIDVKIDAVGVSNSAFTQCISTNSYCNLTRGSANWKADDMKELWVDFNALTESDRPRLGVTINYTKAGSTYIKTITGVIQVRPN